MKKFKIAQKRTLKINGFYMQFIRAKAAFCLLFTLSLHGAQQQPKSPPPVITNVKIENDKYHQIWVVITYDNDNQYTCTGYFQDGKTNYLGFGSYAGENTLRSISDAWSEKFFHKGIDDLDKSGNPQMKNIAKTMRKQLEGSNSTPSLSTPATTATTTTSMDLLS